MSSSKPTGDPTVAALLTWFVPGAGHLYLGRVGFALVAFLVVEGLYALGLFLSDGRSFEILPPEMRGQFAPFLSPELGNLGALLFHSSRFGFGGPDPVVFPGTLQAGMALTATSGVLNALLMSRAHLDARMPATGKAPSASAAAPAPEVQSARVRPEVAALASFALPGLGQVLQGRTRRGLLCLGLLLLLFGAGTFLGEGANLDRARHFYYWGGQFFLGLPALLTEAAHGHPQLTHEVAYHDLAVVLGCVAGLLNVLVMLDAYGWSEALLLGRDPRRGERALALEAAGQGSTAPASGASRAGSLASRTPAPAQSTPQSSEAQAVSPAASPAVNPTVDPTVSPSTNPPAASGGGDR